MDVVMAVDSSGTATAPRPTRTASRLRDKIQSARSSGTVLRIAGAGHWLDAGRPVDAGGRLSLGVDAGIVDYVPGDLTLTALAGTTLGTIAATTAAEGQWLALDPFGGAAGTLGATIATGSVGPLATGFGLPRDNVLGLEFVTGNGLVARGGGRVVKNVAGFDLTRLLVGSWGTLGAITEITVRLRALPEVERTIALALPDESTALASAVDAVRRAPLAPLAMELVNAPLARYLGLEPRTQLLVRLGGNEPAVRAQHATLAGFGSLAVVGDAGVWASMSSCEPEDAAVLRLSVPPSRTGALWTAVVGALGPAPGVFVHATPARGVVRCVLPATDAPALLRRLLLGVPAATRIGERLPDVAWTMLGHPAGATRLSREIRRTYDPDGVLNRGILGD